MAHIHLAPAGQNDPVVAWLYPSAPPPVPIPGCSDGVLAAGVIFVTAMADTWADLLRIDRDKVANSERRRRRGRRLWRTRLTPFELTCMVAAIGAGVALTVVLLVSASQFG